MHKSAILAKNVPVKKIKTNTSPVYVLVRKKIPSPAGNADLKKEKKKHICH